MDPFKSLISCYQSLSIATPPQPGHQQKISVNNAQPFNIILIAQNNVIFAHHIALFAKILEA